jgi:hypothetical protein
MRAHSFLLVALLALPIAAGAQGIQKWRTEDGKLYFGDRPPPGAVPLGEVESLGTVSAPEMTEEHERKAAEARARREAG